MTRHYFLLWFTVSMVCSVGLSNAEADVGPTVTLDQPAHFTAVEGNDVQLPVASYRVEQFGDSGLRLMRVGAPPIEIQATRIPHDESISAPLTLAVMEEGQDEVLHLVLLLPDGQALDAAGSFSGVQSRATFSPTLRPLQLQSAVTQIKVTPQPAPLHPAPQQILPASSIIRVPQASVGNVIAAVNQGIWITWNYLAMQHPEVVAQTFADVQAGIKPPSVLAGFASSAELNDMLKSNWTGEAARLNATSLILKQSAVIPRGVPTSPSKALTPSLIASIPIQLSPTNLGTVWANGVALTTISITAASDGYVDAQLDLNATNRHFRIVNAISSTGKVVSGKVEIAQVVQGGQYQDVMVDPHNAPAQISKAGFVSIPTRQGQRIDFTVAFEPVALGMTPVGHNEAILSITGVPPIDIRSNTAPPNWTKIAPIRADFAGINFGAILYTDQQHASTLTGQPVDMPVLVRNASSAPIIGTITAAQAPSGVTLSPTSIPVSIGPQTTQRLILHFKVAGTAQTGTVQPVVVQLNYSNQTRPLTLDMSIYEPWVWFDFGGSMVTGVDAAGNKTYGDRPIPGIPLSRSDQNGDSGVEYITAWLKSNGDFWWRIATYNMKFVDAGGTDFDVFARWKATGSTDKIAVHIGPRTNPQYYESTKNFAPLATSFLATVQQGLTFSLIDR